MSYVTALTEKRKRFKNLGAATEKRLHLSETQAESWEPFKAFDLQISGLDEGDKNFKVLKDTEVPDHSNTRSRHRQPVKRVTYKSDMLTPSGPH